MPIKLLRIDRSAESHFRRIFVIPAKAGLQFYQWLMATAFAEGDVA
jgi:hypothetical protein